MSEATTASTTSYQKVTYVDANGCSYSMSGPNSSRSWRNNNPGNLRYSSLDAAKADGAIGQDSDGYAIFPTYAAGEIAMRDLLLSDYNNHTITTGIPIYADVGPAGNAAYIAFLVANGVDANQLIGSMTIEQFDNLIRRMIQQEGFKVGITSSYYCPNGSYKTLGTPGAPTAPYTNQGGTPPHPDRPPTRFFR